MSKYLVVLIWPACLAAIFGAGFLLARGNQGAAQPSARRASSESGRHHTASRGAGAVLIDAGLGSAQVAIFAAAGTVLVVGLMCLLGLLVVHHGLAIDRPVFTFMQGHRVHVMKSLMTRLTKIGDTWTTWGAAGAAAVCLAVTWKDKRWLPPAALAALIVVDHFATLALRHVFHRVGPPTSPLGTYPSGGCDRCIVFYGLIAYLLWREFSGRRATAIWAACVVAALGFNEAYSRVYLSLHWLTDTLSGLLYGALLLMAFIAAIRVVAGPQLTWRARRSSRAGLATATADGGVSATEGAIA
jgi:membrane-associated phospholipid phosphatase